MDILNVVIAFGLTLLAASTVVTLAVNFYLDFTAARGKVLKKFVSNFYRDELKEVVDNELGDIFDCLNNETKKNNAVERLTSNSVRSRQMWVNESEGLEKIEPKEFILRFRGTEIGKDIEAKLKEKGEVTLNRFFTQLEERFSLAGTAGTQAFAQKSRRYSFWFGIAVALLFNMDAFYIIDTYIKDPKLAQNIALQGEVILKTAEKVVDISPSTDDQSEKEVPPKGNTPEVTEKKLQEDIDEIRASVKSLKSIGLPIGWNQFPSCSKASSDSRCITYFKNIKADASTAEKDKETKQFIGPFKDTYLFFSWFFGFLTMGFLIGMGAPYWFDFVRGISRFAIQVRSGTAPQANPNRGRRVVPNFKES